MINLMNILLLLILSTSVIASQNAAPSGSSTNSPSDELSKTRSPIHLAAIANNIEKIKRLIDEGARLDERDALGNLPIHYSADFRNAQALKLFLEQGININVTDRNGRTLMRRVYSSRDPFTYSSMHSKDPESKHFKECLILFKNYGWDVNKTDNYGNTLLYLAVYDRSVPITKLLLEHSADATFKTRVGQNLLDIAYSRRQSIMNLEYVHEIENRGSTSIHWGDFQKWNQIIELLYENGAGSFMQKAMHNMNIDYSYITISKFYAFSVAPAVTLTLAIVLSLLFVMLFRRFRKYTPLRSILIGSVLSVITAITLTYLLVNINQPGIEYVWFGLQGFIVIVCLASIPLYSLITHWISKIATMNSISK